MHSHFARFCPSPDLLYIRGEGVLINFQLPPTAPSLPSSSASLCTGSCCALLLVFSKRNNERRRSRRNSPSSSRNDDGDFSASSARHLPLPAGRLGHTSLPFAITLRGDDHLLSVLKEEAKRQKMKMRKASLVNNSVPVSAPGDLLTSLSLVHCLPYLCALHEPLVLLGRRGRGRGGEVGA